MGPPNLVLRMLMNYNLYYFNWAKVKNQHWCLMEGVSLGGEEEEKVLLWFSRCASDHGKIRVVVPVPPVPALGWLKFMNRKNKRKSHQCDTRLGCEGQFLDSRLGAVTKMMMPKCNQHWAFSFQLFVLQFIPKGLFGVHWKQIFKQFVHHIYEDFQK